jgi:hypothetical protein
VIGAITGEILRVHGAGTPTGPPPVTSVEHSLETQAQRSSGHHPTVRHPMAHNLALPDTQPVTRWGLNTPG